VRSKGDVRDYVGDGIAAAAVAGTLSGAPSTVHALVTGRGVLDSTRAIAGLVGLGGTPGPVQLATGAALHSAISLGWSTVAAFTLPRRYTVLAGALAGVVVGIVDLGIGRRRVPAMAVLPLGPQLADHVAFGALVGAVIAHRRSIRERVPLEVT
jgi:hypothetical protein